MAEGLSGIAPSPLSVVVAELVECVCTEVATSGSGPLCWCGLWHGDTVSWDYCGECSEGHCGMGWVRVMAAFPYQTFPVPQVDLKCTLPLAYQIEVGVMRCMPTAEEDGTLPDEETIAEASYIAIADAHAMHRALLCCAADMAIEGYLALGPSGGCAGGAWTAFMATDQYG